MVKASLCAEHLFVAFVVPYMATEIAASAVFPYASSSEIKPLSVNVVLLSDLPLKSEHSTSGDGERPGFYSWSRGYRLRHRQVCL